jgi:acetyltransferase-like isoleucine patch superfamily enzyme
MQKTLPKKIKCAIRKFISARIAPHCVLNGFRIFLYRLCGYNIGKNVFIGMRCYLDDVEPGLFTVEDNVSISYGVFFACHGKGQGHTPITIKSGAYLGMRCNVVSSKEGVVIGERAVVGACALVLHDIPAGTTVAGVPAKIITPPPPEMDIRTVD